MEEKLCSGRYGCGSVKPISEFYRKSYGYQTHCKSCNSKATRIRRQAIYKQAQLSGSGQCYRCKREVPAGQLVTGCNWCRACQVELDREKKYGSMGYKTGWYEKQLERQEGKCAICESSDPGTQNGFFHIDHCHTTYKLRGLLCHSCNTRLAPAAEDPLILKAMAYVGIEFPTLAVS